MSLLDHAVGHLQEMFPQHSAVSLVHLLERLHFDVGAAAEQLLSTPDSRSPCTSVIHLPINAKGAASVSPELEDVDISDHLQVTENTATSAPSSAALQQSLQSAPQQHIQAQSSLGLLWSEPACRVAHVPLINPTPTPTLIQAARPQQACSPHVTPSTAATPPFSKDPLAFLDDLVTKSVSGAKPSASPPEALFFHGQPPSAPTTPMTSASTHSSVSTAFGSMTAAATAGHTGHQSLRYQSVPDFDDNNSDSDWSDAEDSAGGGPANVQPSRLFGDAHIPRDAFGKLAVLGEPFQKLGLELIACTLLEAGFDVTLASDRCLALLNSQSNAAEHDQEAEERVQADSNLSLVSCCIISWHYHLLLNRRNSDLVPLHALTFPLRHCVNGICIQKPIAFRCFLMLYTVQRQVCNS